MSFFGILQALELTKSYEDNDNNKEVLYSIALKGGVIFRNFYGNAVEKYSQISKAQEKQEGKCKGRCWTQISTILNRKMAKITRREELNLDSDLN